MDFHGNRCVLVADDDPGIRTMLITYLRRQGFQMLEARNGREALDEMRAGKADVVVMDLMMPVVSGWEVLQERAASAAMLQVPMIVITANNYRDATASVSGKHVRAVLGKPFDLVALLTAVNDCLEPPHIPELVAA